jgi:hypothetical protein
VTFNIRNQIVKIERHNLYLIKCLASDIPEVIQAVEQESVKVLNIGKELSELLKKNKQTKFLNLESQEKLHNLIERTAVEIEKGKPKVLGIYNLGILFEPILEMHAVKILKELSKTISIIILWENLADFSGKLCWSEQQEKYFFDFEDVNLKQLNPLT